MDLTPEQQRAILVKEVQALTKIVDKEGWMTTGSTGQKAVHPAVSQRRAALEAIRRLDADNPKQEEDPLAEFLKNAD